MKNLIFLFALIFSFFYSIAVGSYIYSQHGVSSNWSNQYEIGKTNPSSYATKGGTGQNLVRLSNGDLVQCFIETNNGSKIYLIKSITDGETWNNPINYSSTLKTNLVSGATISKDSLDNIHLVWLSNAPNKALYYSKMDKNFNVLIDTLRVDNISLSGDYKAPYITVDRKMQVHVFWQIGDEGLASTDTSFAKVSYVRSVDNGLNWDSQKILSDTSFHKHAAYPRTNFSGVQGNILAVPWRQQVTNGANWDVWIAVSSDGGENWIPKLIASTNDSEWDPGVIVDKNNRIHLHYHEYQNGNFLISKIEYAYSDDLGETWSPTDPFGSISPTGIKSQLSVFAYDFETNLHCICWKDERDAISPINTRADNMCSYSIDNGSTWFGQEFVTDLDTIELIFKTVEVGSNGVVYSSYEYTNLSGIRSIYLKKRNPILTLIEENETFYGVQIFPNPVKDEINLISKTKIENVKLTDNSGKIVMQSTQSKFQVSQFENGIYFIQISLENDKIIHSKIIIKH